MTKILIAEDEAPLLRLLTNRLASDGYEIIECSDGKTALLEAMSKLPDLLLLDINLPEMSGVEVLHEVRQDKSWGSTVKAVMLTNLQADGSILEAVSVDVPTLYLIKADNSLEQISEKIKEVLAQ